MDVLVFKEKALAGNFDAIYQKQELSLYKVSD